MRPSFLHWLLCLGAVAAALVGIGLLQAGDAHATTATIPEASPLQCIPDEHTLCIHYVDFKGRPHEFDCPVDPVAISAEENSFGYPLEGKKAQGDLDGRLIEKIKQEAGTEIAPYMNVSIEKHSDAPRSEAPVFWKYKHPIFLDKSLPSKLRAKGLEAREKIINLLANDMKQKVYDDYYFGKGFWKGPFSDDKGRPEYEITYRRLADRGRPLLADCFAEFTRQAGAGDDQEVMALLSALFQEMAFDLPKNEKGLYKKDFRTPTAVLQRFSGDCDSKSVALCSLWRKPGPQMILLLADLTKEEKASVPPELQARQHAFLGYESSAGTVRAGVRHYTLYEATHALDPAAEKLLPGKVLVSSPPQRGICLTDDCCGLDQANCPVFVDAPDERR